MVKSKPAVVDKLDQALTQSVEQKLNVLLGVDNCSISHLYDNQYMVHFSYPIPTTDALKSYAKKLESVGISAKVSSSSFMSAQLIFDNVLADILFVKDEPVASKVSSSNVSTTILKKIMRLKG